MTTIFRVHKEAHTIINNDSINDKRLSAEALGVLVYLLSKSDDTINRSEIQNRFGIDSNKLDRILSELKEIEVIQ
jgi:DNA-binding IscR family transcriptional regulator